MRIITEAVLDQCVSLTDIIAAVEKAFCMQEQGGYLMPERLHYGTDDVFLLMPCFKPDMFSTKLITIYPKNRGQGRPVTMANVLLNDARTGEALALINGTYLTAMRTGAVGAVSAKYLSPANASSCGVIGAGIQGLFQALAISAVRPITDIYLYDPFLASCEAFTSRLVAKRPDLRCHTLPSSRDVVEKAQIIACATTSVSPVLPDEEALYRGKHVVGIGSYQPHTAEFSAAALAAAVQDSGYVFVDTLYAMEESGDLAIPLAQGRLQKHQVQPLNKLVGRAVDQRLAEGATLFKSVGIALFDLLAAEAAYRQAESQDAGLTVIM